MLLAGNYTKLRHLHDFIVCINRKKYVYFNGKALSPYKNSKTTRDAHILFPAWALKKGSLSSTPPLGRCYTACLTDSGTLHPPTLQHAIQVLHSSPQLSTGV
jgi:hypothetical protein